MVINYFKTKLGITQKNKTETTPPMKKFLIAGLGNIGEKYNKTRHNIGFKILDAFAEKEALTFKTEKLGAITTYTYKGRTFTFLKPTTYMNLSGKAVRYWMLKKKIPLEHVLIITDDINLPFGTIRLKTKGSHGGHNGLKDIELHLKTQQYNRFRFGVGADFSRGRQVDYVLGTWNQEEEEKLPERLQQACALITSFGMAGITHTMNTFNGK